MAGAVGATLSPGPASGHTEAMLPEASEWLAHARSGWPVVWAPAVLRAAMQWWWQRRWQQQWSAGIANGPRP
eukprot:10868530-Lingulodinium_polyedra.AAC.1